MELSRRGTVHTNNTNVFPSSVKQLKSALDSEKANRQTQCLEDTAYISLAHLEMEPPCLMLKRQMTHPGGAKPSTRGKSDLSRRPLPTYTSTTKYRQIKKEHAARSTPNGQAEQPCCTLEKAYGWQILFKNALSPRFALLKPAWEIEVHYRSRRGSNAEKICCRL